MNDVLITGVFVGSVAQHLAAGDSLAAGTHALSMVGLTTTCLIIGLIRHRPLTAEQHEDLTTLARKAIGLVAFSLIAQQMWGDVTVGAPLVVTLTGAGLILFAGDAARIALRTRSRTPAT